MFRLRMGGGKELEESAGGVLTGVGDDAGHHDGGWVQDGNTGGPSEGQQLAGRIRVGLGDGSLGIGFSVT